MSRLKSIKLPDSVKKISYRAFEHTALKTFEFPPEIDSISAYTFYKSKLEKIVIPSKIKIIDRGAFGSCWSLSEVTLNEGLTDIMSNAFHWCRELKSIKFPESLKEIGSSAFDGCCSLDNIIIPKNVIKIGSEAFSRCRRDGITVFNYSKAPVLNCFNSYQKIKTGFFPNEDPETLYDSHSLVLVRLYLDEPDKYSQADRKKYSNYIFSHADKFIIPYIESGDLKKTEQILNIIKYQRKSFDIFLDTADKYPEIKAWLLDFINKNSDFAAENQNAFDEIEKELNDI